MDGCHRVEDPIQVELCLFPSINCLATCFCKLSQKHDEIKSVICMQCLITFLPNFDSISFQDSHLKLTAPYIVLFVYAVNFKATISSVIL